VPLQIGADQVARQALMGPDLSEAFGEKGERPRPTRHPDHPDLRGSCHSRERSMARRAWNPARSEGAREHSRRQRRGAVADNAPMQIVPIEPIRRGRE
jgi:hypothetical protein